jgi:hypothetical protein
VLLEHVVLHEIRSHLHYAGVKGSLAYWRTPAGSEVDFVWWHGSKRVAIEVKHGHRYRPEYRKGLASLLSSTRADSYIVYLGERELNVEGTRVLPVETFVRRLHAGAFSGNASPDEALPQTVEPCNAAREKRCCRDRRTSSATLLALPRSALPRAT